MSGFLHSKKFLGIAILFVLLLIVIPAIFLLVTYLPAKQAQNGQSSTKATKTSAAFTDNTELATFNAAPIYVKDLNALALEQYQTTDAKTLKTIDLDILLNTYIERKILDKQNLGDVSAQVAQIVKTTGSTGNAAKYEALRKKIAATQKSWTILTVSFWLSPTKTDGSILENGSPINEKYANLTNAERKQIVADVNSALDFAKTQLQNGASVSNVAAQISKNYPSLSIISNILSVNGGIFDNSIDPTIWNQPKDYYFNSKYTNLAFYKTLYSMTGESPVTKVLSPNNMGGQVIKIVKVNNPNGILDNYQNWLKNQESGLKIINPAILKVTNTK